MQRRPTVGPGSQKSPFRERLLGTISKLGKGTALQRGPNGGASSRYGLRVVCRVRVVVGDVCDCGVSGRGVW